MKRTGLIVFSLVAGQIAIAQDRPNIVLIMVDDMGFSDIGCFGGEIETPNLDMLANNGVRFTQFYNTSRCCPSRASLLTGLYHHQAGIGLMIEDRTELPGYKGHLVRERCTSIAEVLQNNGYGTYMTGKWHVGYQEMDERPLAWGFDRFYGSLEGAISYFEPGNPERYPHDRRPRHVTLDHDTIVPDKDYYATDKFTEYAKMFLDEHFEKRKDDPFFLYMAYNTPHWPLHALPHDIEKYKNTYLVGWDHIREERYKKLLELGIIDAKSSELSPRTDDRYPREGLWPMSRIALPAWDTLTFEQQEDLAKRMAVYAAMVDNLDQNIGRLLQYLDERNLTDNTMIMFFSDNGGDLVGGIWGFNAMGERGQLDLYGTTDSFMSYGLGWANVSNTPFRMYKCYVHEGGIASPLIVHWPAGISVKSGSLDHTPTHIIDMMPSVLEAAGVEYPLINSSGYRIIEMQGESILPLLSGNSRAFDRNRSIFWEHGGNKAVRQGKWKLVQVQKGEWELYNMDKDRSENHDLSGKYRRRTARMIREYNDWADRAYVNPPLHE
jgi:arylsulfatase A-like enzyme